MLYLSRILNKSVYYENKFFGKISDVAVLESYLFHPVSKIRIKKNGQSIEVVAQAMDLSQKPFTLKEIKIPAMHNGPGDFYLKRNLYGKQVLDIHGRRLVKVHDVLLENGGEPTLAGIDIGLAGFFRRFGLSKFIEWFHIKPKVLPWQLVESLDYRTGAVRIKLREEKLNFAHYLELADILREVEREEQQTFLQSLLHRRKKHPKLSKFLLKVGQEDAVKALETMQSFETGLSLQDVERRRNEYGKNEIAKEKPQPGFIQFLLTFFNPFIGILFILGVASFLTDVLFSPSPNWSKIIILAFMVFLSSVLRFWQEFRSQKESEKLQALVQNNSQVSRKRTPHSDPRKREISIAELVPGDIVYLSAGDMIPADVRLLSSKDLFVSQAALTGESAPVEKHSELQAAAGKENQNPLELETLCFLGSNVISGSAVAVVVATGGRTFFGSIAANVLGRRVATSFDRGIKKVSFVLIRFMLIMVPLVFLLNGFEKGDWQQALFFALAVAVGLTPEMLPLIVTANLAKGAVNMAKKKVIVKKLGAIQNFGAMDILCTDKTGTITEDRVVLVVHLDPQGKESNRVLSFAYLNSYYQAGLKNLIDQAVIRHKEEQYDYAEERSYLKVDEVPFDFTRRRMSVVVQKDSQCFLICKGAVEEILGVSNRIESGTIIELSPQEKDEMRQLVDQLNSEGLRVIGVAYKEVPAQDNYTVQDESNLILVGYMGFLDPPKTSAKPALAQLAMQGVQVKILTGDNEIVTAKVCRDVGIETKTIVLGNDIEAMSDAALADLAEETVVFAKMDPMQKARVIRALRSKGHTVGFMGDGINDASAMRDGDVAISVDSAVDIAKESADIILLEKDLGVLEQGVMEGRTVFGNIMKYIKMAASSNFGNVLSVLAASVFLPFLPMLPIQILIQNLLYDISQTAIPFDSMDKEFLEKPRKWEASGITRFMVSIGPLSSVFDITTFLVLWFVFGANSPAHQSLFQTGWFAEGLLSQTLIVHLIRTQKIPFFQSVAAPPLLFLTFLIAAVGLYLPFSPLAFHVGMQQLPMHYFPWLLLTMVGYGILTQLAKTLYIKKFRVWL